jgi:uncharacterized protein YkwD
MRVFLLALVGVIAALTAATRPLPAAQPQYPQYGATTPEYGGPDVRAALGQIYALTNQARAQAGVAALNWDPALAAAAMQHCRRMAAAGAISHQYRGEPDLTTRAAQAGAHFSLIEENVAMAPSAAAVHQAWMQSPGHRENLLNPEVDHVGIALVYARGALYAVADYSAAAQSLSPAQVEERVVSQVRAGVDDSLAELRSLALAAGARERTPIGKVSEGRGGQLSAAGG